MTNPTATPASSVKRRQYLLLGGIAAIVLGATFIGVALTSSKQDNTHAEKPRTTNVLTPGAQVDPKDAWRGQADAQMKAIEQKSLEVAQKNTELAQQNKEMLERLKKLEQSALTPLPPAPVPAPPARPDFGPDVPGKSNPNSITGPQILQPPPAPKGTPLSMPPGKPPAPALATPSTPGSSQPAIISVSLGDGPKPAKATTDDPKKPNRNAGNYMPSGSFARAVLLGGLDAPTGGQAQRNPQPVLLRLTDNAILPSQFRFRVKECFVVGAGYGDTIRTGPRLYVLRDVISPYDIPSSPKLRMRFQSLGKSTEATLHVKLR